MVVGVGLSYMLYVYNAGRNVLSVDSLCRLLSRGLLYLWPICKWEQGKLSLRDNSRVFETKICHKTPWRKSSW